MRQNAALCGNGLKLKSTVRAKRFDTNFLPKIHENHCNRTISLSLLAHVSIMIMEESSPDLCGVHGREVERRPRNHKIPSSSPGCGSQLWDFSLAHTFGASTGVVPRKQNRERLV